MFLLGFYLAYLARSHLLVHVYAGFRPDTFPFLHYVVSYPYFWPLCVTILAYEGLYSQRYSSYETLKRIWRATSISFVLLMLITFVTRTSIQVSRTVIVLAWLITLIVLPYFRSVLTRILLRLGLWQKRLLVIGTGPTAAVVARRLEDATRRGYSVVGFITPEGMNSNHQSYLPALGSMDQIEEMARRHQARDAVIAVPEISRAHLQRIVTRCEGAFESIRLVPDFLGITTAGLRAEDFDGLVLVNLRWQLVLPWNRLLKRTADILGAAIPLVVLSPVLGIAALTVYIETRRPIFYTCSRLGKSFKPFTCYKFRTMFRDADIRLNRYLAQHPQAAEEWRRYAKLRQDDPRVTKVGRILRRWSLDELPQLVNVLRGEMSLVGPRPYLAREIGPAGASLHTILKARPGITGLWQVSGRSQLPFSERLRLEEYYVRNWSPWLDLLILLRTGKAVISRVGAV